MRTFRFNRREGTYSGALCRQFLVVEPGRTVGATAGLHDLGAPLHIPNKDRVIKHVVRLRCFHNLAVVVRRMEITQTETS